MHTRAVKVIDIRVALTIDHKYIDARAFDRNSLLYDCWR